MLSVWFCYVIVFFIRDPITFLKHLRSKNIWHKHDILLCDVCPREQKLRLLTFVHLTFFHFCTYNFFRVEAPVSNSDRYPVRILLNISVYGEVYTTEGEWSSPIGTCTEKTIFSFPFTWNGIWAWWQFSSRFWTKWNFIRFQIERKTVTTIVSHSIWKEIE